MLAYAATMNLRVDAPHFISHLLKTRNFAEISNPPKIRHISPCTLLILPPNFVIR